MRILSYKLTKIAESDLLQIKYCGDELWGKELTKKYLTTIHNKCIEICDFPNIGRKRPEILKDVRSLVVGSHIIFYRFLENEIHILRIMHKNMDFGEILNYK